jgi:hypothetical protein
MLLRHVKVSIHMKSWTLPFFGCKEFFPSPPSNLSLPQYVEDIVARLSSLQSLPSQALLLGIIDGYTQIH